MKILRAVLFVVGALLGAVSFGQLTGARPTFTFQKGINFTPDCPEFVQGSTVAWVHAVGLDHVRIAIDIERGEAIMPAATDLAQRLQADGVGVIFAFFYSGSSVAAIEEDEKLFCTKYVPKLQTQGTAIELLNEPVLQVSPRSGVRWSIEQWCNKIQPEIYAIVRKCCPKNIILLSPSGISSWEAFQTSQGGNMWLPADTSLAWVVWHAYTLAWDGTMDTVSPEVLSVISQFAKTRKVRVQVTEFGGGEDEATPWSTVLNRIATRTKVFAQLGLGWASWHWAKLETAAHGIRYDMLLALMGATYSPPLDGTATKLAAAGSSTVSFGLATALGH